MQNKLMQLLFNLLPDFQMLLSSGRIYTLSVILSLNKTLILKGSKRAYRGIQHSDQHLISS